MNTKAPVVAAIALSLVGVGLSAYLSYEHYTGSTTLVCSANGAVDCLKVTTSSWSTLAGIPVAVLGLAFFAAMTLLCLPIRATQPWHLLRITATAVGVIMVLWLVYVEIFNVEAICLWCTGVHVVTLLLFCAVAWWREADRPTDR